MTGNITRDKHGVLIAAAVVWPDGTRGRYAATKQAARFGNAVDAYTITYGIPPGRTYVQPAVTRNEAGQVIRRPPITVR
jgi:hypothetical protein